MTQTYTIHQLAEAVGIARTQLEQWITRGHFRPEQAEPETRARAFSLTDAIRLSAHTELVRLGLTPAAASQHTGHLHAFKDDAALLVLIQGETEIKFTGGKTVVFYDPDQPRLQSKIIRLGDLSRLVSNPQVRTLAIVNLDEVEKRITTALTKQGK